MTPRNVALSISIILLLSSCTGGGPGLSNICKQAFLAAIDSGAIHSVNGLAISPGYRSYYVTEWFDGKAGLVGSECRHGSWSARRPLYSIGKYQDYQPVLSQDGERLYFTSTRPIEGDEPVRQNVWMASKQSKWGDAAPILALVSPEWDGHAVEISSQLLLFASGRSGKETLVDIFEFDRTANEARINPVTGLNSKMSDNDLAFDDGSELLVFSRYDPETEDIDLFAAVRSGYSWSNPVALTALNTNQWELSPAFTPDGEYLLFKRGEGPFQSVPIAKIAEFIARSDM